MMIVSTDGHLVEVIGPFLADAKIIHFFLFTDFHRRLMPKILNQIKQKILILKDLIKTRRLKPRMTVHHNENPYFTFGPLWLTWSALPLCLLKHTFQ